MPGLTTASRSPARSPCALAISRPTQHRRHAYRAPSRYERPDARAGSTYPQVRTVPRPSGGTLEVTEFEPARRLTIRGAFGPLSGQATYVLEPAGDVTKLTNAMDLNAKGALRLVAPLATGRVSA